MSTQLANDIPFSASHHQQAFKLIELPPELLALLESDSPPTLTITSTAPTETTPGYALLNTGTKAYQMRQKNTSNPIMILQPSSTGPTEADDASTFVPQPSICTIAKIEDTIELIPQSEGAAKAPPKVNKWHEKFAKSRVTKCSKRLQNNRQERCAPSNRNILGELARSPGNSGEILGIREILGVAELLHHAQNVTSVVPNHYALTRGDSKLLNEVPNNQRTESLAMAPDRLNRPVRILLLDNAWPNEVSSNIQRLKVLQQLMNEIEPTDNPASTSGPSKLFDLIVVRDSPFFRHATNAYYRFGRDGEQWLDFIVRDGISHLGHVRDENFLGYAPPSESFRYDLPLIARGSAKILLHNPSTRKIKRSYETKDDHPLPRIEPGIERSYAVAFGRSKGGLLFEGIASSGLLPLMLLAKEESRRCYPHDPILIVEINSLFSLHGLERNEFMNWFREARGHEIYFSHHEVAKGQEGTPNNEQTMPEAERDKECRSKVTEFETALREFREKRPGYTQQDLQGIEYHHLRFGSPELNIEDLNGYARNSTYQRYHQSQELWKIIRLCAIALKPPTPPPPYSVQDDRTDLRPLRLLAFDGGGVRGLTSLLILREILGTVQKANGLASIPLPCDYFDMIAGTGTGGLIAILLGRLKISVDACITAYEEIAKNTFGKEQSYPATTRFSSKNFTAALKAHIRKLKGGGSDDILLRDLDVEVKGCPVFVVSVDREHFGKEEGTVLLRSYDTKNGRTFEESCYLWEAAVATCSTPVFFHPAQVKGKTLLDGGLGQNNPTQYLITEAKARWPGRPLGAVVSIGTGKARVNLQARDMKNPIAAMRLLAYYHMAAMSSKNIERSGYEYFRQRGRDGQLDCFYRFEVESGLEVELHEYRRSEEIRNSTKRYLQDVVPDLVKTCARKLEGEAVDAPPRRLEVPSPDPLDEAGDSLEDSMTEPESQELIQQWLDIESPLPIELKPLYQLDTIKGSIPARTISLDPVSKIPLDPDFPSETPLSTTVTQTNTTSPAGGLAFSFNTNAQPSCLLIQYSESASNHKITPGLWRVHWLLLFHRLNANPNESQLARASTLPRHRMSDASVTGHRNTDGDFPFDPPLNPNTRNDTSPTPRQAQLHFLATILPKADNKSTTTITSTATYGTDIAYPAETLREQQWQDVGMDPLLKVPGLSEGRDEGLEIEFSLDFQGWDEGTTRLGRRTGWRVYFGGLRLMPVHDDDF